MTNHNPQTFHDKPSQPTVILRDAEIRNAETRNDIRPTIDMAINITTYKYLTIQ